MNEGCLIMNLKCNFLAANTKA